MKAVASIQPVWVKLSTVGGLSSQGSLAGADFRAFGYRKYVLENISLLLTIYWQNKEIVAMLPSKSSHCTHQEKLKLDGSGNAISFERLQPQHLPTMSFNM